MFRVGGFNAGRNRKFRGSGGVKHEIDVVLRGLGEEGKFYFIECKDTKIQKGYADTFIGKMTDLISPHGEKKVQGGALITTRYDKGQLEKYRDYCKKHNIRFVDAKELKSLWDLLVKYKDLKKFRQKLIDFFGLREPVAQEEEESRCFIATASLGSPLHPKLDVLRNFRDSELLNSTFGESLVRSYYKISPPFADIISRSGKLRKICRRVLVEPIISLLEE